MTVNGSDLYCGPFLKATVRLKAGSVHVARAIMGTVA